MSNFLSGPVQVAAQTLHSSSADQYHKLGELIFSNDGRAFRYAKAGIALVAGNLQQCQAEDTDTQNLAVAAAAIGALSIVTTTTVTVTANEYAEGFICGAITPGIGKQYKIKGHAAATSAVVTFNLDESVRVALTTDSRLDAIASPHAAVVVAPTTRTGAIVGLAVHAIAAAEFGWLQVCGVGTVVFDGTISVGLEVVSSDNTAGGVETIADGANELLPIIGQALTAGTTAEHGMIQMRWL